MWWNKKESKNLTLSKQELIYLGAATILAEEKNNQPLRVSIDLAVSRATKLYEHIYNVEE